MNIVSGFLWTLICMSVCTLPLAANAALIVPVPKDSKTSNTVVVEGHRISYQAIAGNIVLRNASGTPQAQMFYVAYLKAADKDASQRPITFFYNGGPGSSSVYLHMGAFGPRRVVVANHAHTPAAPYRLVNNNYSLLDATDMVFIDAPSTGFSRILTKKLGGAGKPSEFYGIDQDANAFARFIVQFLTKYHRWNSPKFLFGESYGTTRSVVLGRILQQKYSIDLNGIILLSAILNFSTSTDEAHFSPGIDLSYELALPSFAASAWYHKKLGDQYPSLQPLLRSVEQFATGPYTNALMDGSTLDHERFLKIATEMSRYTGLPVRYIEKADLRVTARQFEKELLSDSDETVGRLDSRYKGPSMDPLSEMSEYDPTGSSMKSAFISSLNAYVQQSLGYKTSLHYRPNYGVQKTWDWQHQPPGFKKHTRVIPSVSIDLADEMKHNPELRIMLNAGYYDLATPFYAAVYVMHHLQIPNYLQRNITYKFYKSGHMVYLHVPSLEKLHNNVVKFIAAATSKSSR